MVDKIDIMQGWTELWKLKNNSCGGHPENNGTEEEGNEKMWPIRQHGLKICQ